MVWDRAGRLVQRLRGPVRTRMFDVAFSPLSRLVVGASSDGTARTWIAHSGERNSIMPLHGNQVRRASFGENEDSVLTASRDGSARTWKVVTGGPRATFLGHTDTVTAAVFAPGDLIATASLDQTVRTWISQLQPRLRPASVPAPRPTLDPRATVTGATVTLRLGGRPVELVGHDDLVVSVEVSTEGSRVVTASRDGDARIWDARTGELIHRLRDHVPPLFDASFSPNGRWVVTAGRATAGLWDARTGERIFFLQGHERGHLLAAAFSGPTLIVTSGADGVRSFNCDTCGELDHLRALAARRLAVTGRTFSNLERRLYLGG
jgi:WD40 repeat protein